MHADSWEYHATERIEHRGGRLHGESTLHEEANPGWPILNGVTRRRVLSTSAAALAVGLAGCGGSGDGSDGGGGTGNTVDMTDELVFDPETISISVGDTVTWENPGSVGHSVTAYEDAIPDGAEYFASGGFDSESAARDAYSPGDADAGDIPGGETYRHTFETAGTYEYFCIPHESAEMIGTVEVEA